MRFSMCEFPAAGDGIARVGAATVLAAHRVVHWPDASRITVHRVVHAQGGERTHLALREPRSQAWLVFEARAVDAELAADLRAHPWADAGAVLHFNLRHHFAGADALVRAVLQQQAEDAVAAYAGQVAA